MAFNNPAEMHSGLIINVLKFGLSSGLSNAMNDALRILYDYITPLFLSFYWIATGKNIMGYKIFCVLVLNKNYHPCCNYIQHIHSIQQYGKYNFYNGNSYVIYVNVREIYY